MNKRVYFKFLLTIIATLLSLGCSDNEKKASIAEADLEVETRCSAEGYRWIDQQVMTSDGRGHGPDVGSEEWQSVVEFKLGVRDDPQVPDRFTASWCDYVVGLITNR